jgi:hypothetical protein
VETVCEGSRLFLGFALLLDVGLDNGNAVDRSEAVAGADLSVMRLELTSCL